MASAMQKREACLLLDLTQTTKREYRWSLLQLASIPPCLALSNDATWHRYPRNHQQSLSAVSCLTLFASSIPQSTCIAPLSSKTTLDPMTLTFSP